MIEAPVAVVTGAASGMGAASARLLAEQGWALHLLDRSDEVESIAKTLTAAGNSVVWSQVDVSRRDDVIDAISTTARDFGRIDALVNCAGVDGKASRLTEIDEAELDRVLGVNLKGVLWSMQAVLPAMIERKSGSIVNIASASALVGIPRLGAYTASKGAVLALSRAAAVELARKGIRVNSINPGVVRTRMFEESANFDPEQLAASGGGAPIGRIGTAEEIAHAVLYFVSPASGFTTGTSFVIDGGMTAQ